ncbi:hypothetical protein KP79_PYT12528 [Mizuhopecten yessoensis]|uniref:Uncharacterized protein n=1 Tax=Mizuhopecten yessoensis TaxID=6573 RepID=A0A210QE92_MIZYE|nr:hypothetical protein KP79_PYT12528 [Mizuhopecten yessoensis]
MALPLSTSSCHSALETQCHLGEHRASATDNHCVRTATFVRARGDPVALKETLLRCYGDLTAIPLRSYQDAERRSLSWACSKCAPSLGVLCDPTAFTDIL